MKQERFNPLDIVDMEEFKALLIFYLLLNKANEELQQFILKILDDMDTTYNI